MISLQKLKKLTLKQLQQVCMCLNISKSGVKDKLIKHIRKCDSFPEMNGEKKYLVICEGVEQCTKCVYHYAHKKSYRECDCTSDSNRHFYFRNTISSKISKCSVCHKKSFASVYESEFYDGHDNESDIELSDIEISDNELNLTNYKKKSYHLAAKNETLDITHELSLLTDTIKNMAEQINKMAHEILTLKQEMRVDSEIKESQKHIGAKKVTKKTTIPASLRNAVWATYIGTLNKYAMCFCCSVEQITTANYECGHIQAKSKDGATTIKNLRPICGACNKSMGSCNMEEFMEQYGFEKCNNWNGIKTFKNKN